MTPNMSRVEKCKSGRRIYLYDILLADWPVLPEASKFNSIRSRTPITTVKEIPMLLRGWGERHFGSGAFF